VTKPHSYVLSVAGTDGVFAELCTATATETEFYLLDEINRIAKALELVKFRGTATFQIATNTGDLAWTCIVTFSDDAPKGIWNNTNHHAE